MRPLEAELRTQEFPDDFYPDHWGTFPIHDIFPIDKHLRPLDVEYYQICLTTPKYPDYPILLGFDDFAPVWPVDPEMPEKAIQRRDKFRGMAEFRALVRVRKVKHLTPGGVERLRDAGADVSEAACREGCLVVAVTGKFRNFPLYYPDRGRTSGILFVQYIHEFDAGTAHSQQRMAERNLYLASIDMRTFARSMLYFERIKLRCFMVGTHKENRESTPVDERDIDWFVQKYMEKYPFAATALRKPQEYRGARKHTSEARHCFVCHAEWLLHHAGLTNGPDRVINRKVLERWAADAPAKREGAARDGRDGWGKWDSQWDKADLLASHKKEYARLKYFIAQIRREREEKGQNDSGNEGEDENDDIEMLSNHSNDKRANSVVTRGGKVKGGNYAHAWIHISESDEDDAGPCADSDEDDAILLDDERSSSAKRRKSNSGASLRSGRSSQGTGTLTQPTSSATGWGYQRSSPSLGGSFRSSQSLGGPSSQPRAGPSRLPAKGPSSSRRESNLAKQVEFIVLSSDHDEPVRDKSSSPVLDVPTDSDREEHSLNARGEGSSRLPPVKPESTTGSQLNRSGRLASQPTLSDSEEEIPESEVESVPKSSDSESKYKRVAHRPTYTPEQLKQRRLKELNTQIIKFAPVVFYALDMPNSWAPWHCECPPMTMPFRSHQSLAIKHKCRYPIDLRKPSEDVIRLLTNSPEATDAELLKHLLAKPSPLIRPWDDLPAQILKRCVELHWGEHYAAWGVKKVFVRVRVVFLASSERGN
ncbi:hypothetical protein FRC10_010451 [Ceratobasidium sp. 414]|nr:hypothetical protein FRC10_010451 [Ceratobasidium sp. 414]